MREPGTGWGQPGRHSGPAGDQFAYGLESFLEEARTLAHFDQHPGIVTVKNFFRAHGTGYCVMDYVAGITLRQYLDQQPGGRISVSDALNSDAGHGRTAGGAQGGPPPSGPGAR